MNFHGITGEAKVGYTKGQEDFLKSLSNVFINVDFEYKPFKVKSVKFTSKFAVFKFEGINSINDILLYKGCIIYADKADAEENLGEDEFIADNLIGMNVFINEKRVGSVTGVSSNGAQPLLSVKTLSENISLVPFVKEIVLDVNKKKKQIKIADIKGLLD